MACFHPNHIVVRDGQHQFLGSASYLKSGDLFYDSPVSFHTLVPCGHCMGCRLDRARVWADRMLLELRDNNYKALFVTMTYDDESIPLAAHVGYNYFDGFYEDSDPLVIGDDESWIAECAAGAPVTLSVRDTQLFMKRLRRTFDDRRIRFFLAGEYGPRMVDRIITQLFMAFLFLTLRMPVSKILISLVSPGIFQNPLKRYGEMVIALLHL